MRRFLTATTLAAVALAGVIGLSTPASATLSLGVQLFQTGPGTTSLVGSADPLILSQSWGTFTTNVEVNTVTTSPFSIDLNSTNISTDTGGTLVITASATGLTSPLGVTQFLSTLTGHLVFGSGTVEMQTYVTDNGAMFAAAPANLVDTIGPASPSSLPLSQTGSASLTNPWTVTEVITLVANGAAEFSLDGSTVTVPEPASLSILGSALLGFGLIRRRRRNAA